MKVQKPPVVDFWQAQEDLRRDIALRHIAAEPLTITNKTRRTTKQQGRAPCYGDLLPSQERIRLRPRNVRDDVAAQAKTASGRFDAAPASYAPLMKQNFH